MLELFSLKRYHNYGLDPQNKLRSKPWLINQSGGRWMQVVSKTPKKHLVLKGSTATVKIDVLGNTFHIEAKIQHPCSGKTTRRSRTLSKSEFLEAFGIGTGGTLSGREVAKKFVRQNYYLNIPERGTGKNGDPNLSIFLDSEIQEQALSLVRV